MVNDMYAIYESYKLLKEDVPRANANHTTEFGSNLPQYARYPNPQGLTSGDLGQDNEETTIPKDILKILNSITNSAHKADHSNVIIDCSRLRKVLSKYSIKPN
jgi:hypothetical protein